MPKYNDPDSWYNDSLSAKLDEKLDRAVNRINEYTKAQADRVIVEVRNNLIGVLRADEFQLGRAVTDQRIHDIGVGIIRDLKNNGEIKVTG